MPPPPGVPDWVYPGMLLFGRNHHPGERWVIREVEMDDVGNVMVDVRPLRTVNGESRIDRRGHVGVSVNEVVRLFEPLGYFNQISPYPRFRQMPRERVHSPLRDALQMFGSAMHSMGGQFIAGEDRGLLRQVGTSTPEEVKLPARTAFERILDEDED